MLGGGASKRGTSQLVSGADIIGISLLKRKDSLESLTFFGPSLYIYSYEVSK